jgi:hypothetical protein
MIHVDDVWYLFFEVMNQQRSKGEIGLATSDDVLTWTYQQIVLTETFHLSYPYVFESDGAYFMIPETLEAGAVRLYQAQSFPDRWSYLGELIPGHWADPSVINFNNRWWMFVSPTPYEHNQLSLYFAEDLLGPWTEHPDSPIVKDDKQSARPAGRVVIVDGKVVRFSQDCAPSYGIQVRAFEISQLTTTAYREVEHGKSPVLVASGSGWNGLRMHHLDPHCLPDGRWIACVDGLGKIVDQSS